MQVGVGFKGILGFFINILLIGMLIFNHPDIATTQPVSALSETLISVFQGSAHSSEEENQLRDFLFSIWRNDCGSWNTHWSQRLQGAGIWKLLSLESSCVLPLSTCVGDAAWGTGLYGSILHQRTKCSSVSWVSSSSPAPRQQKWWWIMFALAISYSGAFSNVLSELGAFWHPSGKAGIITLYSWWHLLVEQSPLAHLQKVA